VPGEEARRDPTVDTLLRGRVVILQPARGFRSSLDPVLLAGFLAPPHGRFLDIGGGTGALSFLLLARDPAATGVAVELQPELARLAAAGRDRNGWSERLEVVTGDVRLPLAAVGAASFDLVVANPPYRVVGEGPPSPDPGRALANHEIALRLADWLDVAARAVRPGGRVAVVFPAAREGELAREMRARGLAIARRRSVHPHAGRPASRVLVEAERGGRRPPVVEEPLIVHDPHELHEPEARYSAEVRRMLGEE
jgi:tRNA1Val (adenine37-N6)-methyltransferase